METPADNRGRLVSLDVFRGLTIAAMLIVNNPGTWASVYPPLRHAAWDGCTPTDLIFPFFLFIVGVSIAFSRRLDLIGARSAAPMWPTVAAVCKRGTILVLLGLFLNLTSVLVRGETDLSAWRLPGVLQRIGVCYVACALLGMFVSIRNQVVIAGVILAGYAALLVWIGAPGSAESSLNMDGNIVAHVDRLLIGGGHMYRPGRHDPEGLLSTLPAIVTTLIGVWVGKGIQGRPLTPASVARLLGIGAVVAAVGWSWGRLGVPLNKELWSSSYVVFTGGCAMTFLAVCMAICDLGRSWGSVLTHPAQTLGLNAMVAFVGSALLRRSPGHAP